MSKKKDAINTPTSGDHSPLTIDRMDSRRGTESFIDLGGWELSSGDDISRWLDAINDYRAAVRAEMREQRARVVRLLRERDARGDASIARLRLLISRSLNAGRLHERCLPWNAECIRAVEDAECDLVATTENDEDSYLIAEGISALEGLLALVEGLHVLVEEVDGEAR